MSKKIAINGFGRIGRCIVRALHERKVADLELVAINDLTNPATLAHLYNYDTVHGRAEQRATAGEGKLSLKDAARRDSVTLLELSLVLVNVFQDVPVVHHAPEAVPPQFFIEPARIGAGEKRCHRLIR